jgi:ABC-2 type transport system permease protein
MKLFFKELKNYRKALIFWCIGMIILIVSGMAKYSAYSGNSQSMSDLIAQFPKSIQIIFGINGFNLSNVAGFYGVLFIYIALTATIHAVLLGTDIISKEERDKTAEFLFVKPISRSKAITSKLFAGLFNILVLNLITLTASIYFVDYFSKSISANKDILILNIAILFLQLLFFFIGTAFAASIKKPKIALSIATAVLLFTFILSFIININSSLDCLKYLSPFRYFDAKIIMTTSGLSIGYVLLTLIVIITAIIITYFGFSKKDLDS